MTNSEMICDGCKYNRPINAWGDVVDACWYRHDTGKELVGESADDKCPDFKRGEHS